MSRGGHDHPRIHVRRLMLLTGLRRYSTYCAMEKITTPPRNTRWETLPRPEYFRRGRRHDTTLYLGSDVEDTTSYLTMEKRIVSQRGRNMYVGTNTFCKETMSAYTAVLPTVTSPRSFVAVNLVNSFGFLRIGGRQGIGGVKGTWLGECIMRDRSRRQRRAVWVTDGRDDITMTS